MAEDQRPTRVTFVINDLARAGAETQLVLLATALDRTRFTPSIVLLKHRNDFEERLAAAAVPVFALRRRRPWDLGLAARLAARLRVEGPDVVHSFLFLPNLLTAWVSMPAAVPRLVLSQRCSYRHQLGPVIRRLARWSHRRADRLIVNSRAIGDEELAAGFPPGRLVCIPNGTPLPPLPEAQSSRRAELGLPVTGALVLALGQLTPEKGHRVLIDAWPAVRARHPDAVLGLVGDGPERAALEACAARHGVASSVTFLGFRDPAGPLLDAADVVVQPSFSEGMPNAVLEAMARARPVVATAVGGVPELVGECARLVPAGAPGALAAALIDLLEDGEARVRLGRSARRRAERHFSVAAMVGATSALYDQLVPPRTDRGDGLRTA